jgi:peptidoglycan/LPS O-acetylase OafA/YrhL
VRAGLAAVVLVPVVGAVSSQYVDTATYSLAVPALAGVVIAEAVVRAAGGERALRRRLSRMVRAVAVAAAVLAVAAGYSFTPGETSLVTPLGRVGPPYALAALAALLWSRPSRRRTTRRRPPRILSRR